MKKFEFATGKCEFEIDCYDGRESIINEIEPAILALGDFLSKYVNKVVQINMPVVIDKYGIHFVEMTLLNDNGAGATYFRCEQSGLAVLSILVEFIRTFEQKPHRPSGWSSCLNIHGETKIMLLESLGIDTRLEMKLQEAEELLILES